jgi:radical SAM/Cys-rich protein
MNPLFRHLVAEARALGVRVIDRCNLTILSEPGHDGLAAFLAEHRVEVTASLPCYAQANVDKQRGDGVFERSISALQSLNALGYGKPESGLVLNLVFNPQGPVLPPNQQQLQRDYKRELAERFGIVFNQLFVIVNMPIQRFGSTLVSKGEFANYMNLLKANYLESNLDSVMCRTLISVDWQGYLYDCDFNQMLGMPARVGKRPRAHIDDLLREDVDGNPIAIADHCYGCTAGQGSSCGGALA